MRCAHCGHETPADSAFCIGCGRTVSPPSPAGPRPSARRRLRVGLSLGLAALLFLAIAAGMVMMTASPRPGRPRSPAPSAAHLPTPPASAGKAGESAVSETPATEETDPLASQLFSTDCYIVRKPSGWELAKSTAARNSRSFVATRQLPGADALRLTIDAFDLPSHMTLAEFCRWTLDWARPPGTRLAEDAAEGVFKGLPTRRAMAKGEQTETAVQFVVRGMVGFVISMTAPTGRLPAHQAEFDEALDTFEFIDSAARRGPESLQPQVLGTAVYTILKPAGWRHQEESSADGGSQFSAIKELPDGGELRLYIGVNDLGPGTSLAAFSDERIGSVRGTKPVEDTSNFSFAGEPARRVLLRSDKGDLMWYFFLHKGMGLAICMEAPAGSFTAHQRDFDEALRTFKLVEGGSSGAGSRTPRGGRTPSKGG